MSPRTEAAPLKILAENVTMVLDRMDFICSIANNLEDICEKISPQLLLVKFSLKECKAVIDNSLEGGLNPKLNIKEEAKTIGEIDDDYYNHGVFGADMAALYPDEGRKRGRKKKIKTEKKPKKTSEVARAFIGFMKEKQNNEELDYKLSEVTAAIETRDFSYFIITPEEPDHDNDTETDKDEIVIPKSESTAENEKNVIKTERLGDEQEKFVPSSNGQDQNMDINRDNSAMEGQVGQNVHYGEEQALNYAMMRDNQGNNMMNNDMMREGQHQGQMMREGQYQGQMMREGQHQGQMMREGEMENREHNPMMRDSEGVIMANNSMMREGQDQSSIPNAMETDHQGQAINAYGNDNVNANALDANGQEIKESKNDLQEVKMYEPLLTCKLCEFSSPNKENLLNHLENSHFSKTSECPQCHIKLMEFEVELHVKKQHSSNCKYCHEPIPQDELKAHQKACLQEKGVLCLVCGKTYGNRIKLRAHMTTHTMEPRVECDICNKMYKSEKVLDHHKRVAHTGKTFKCEECDKEFDRQDYLKKHKMHVHMNNQSMTCTDCGKVFPSELKLNRHMAVHTIPATIPCDICNRLYREMKDLRNHQKVMHSDNIETCYICGATYKLKTSLKKHIKAHLGIKDCTCDLCGKPFSNTTTLKKHVEQFHSVRNMFSCHLCEKTFKYKDTLNYHLKVHSGFVEHCTCEECGKSFTMKNNLKKHMRKVHKIFQKKPILLLDIKGHQEYMQNKKM